MPCDPDIAVPIRVRRPATVGPTCSDHLNRAGADSEGKERENQKSVMISSTVWSQTLSTKERAGEESQPLLGRGGTEAVLRTAPVPIAVLPPGIRFSMLQLRQSATDYVSHEPGGEESKCHDPDKNRGIQIHPCWLVC